jgi:hypothetical protein
MSIVAWWKGEDNFVDSIQPGLPLTAWNTAVDPRFTDGKVGRCFITDSRVGVLEWDALTIGTEPDTQAKTNISSFETWELELYVKIAEQGTWCYIFQAYDFDGGDDFIAATLDRVGDHYYIDIYNQDSSLTDYPLFDNLPLVVGEWYKIRLKYTKASHLWELYIDDVLQTSSSGIYVQSVNDHNYTTYFAGVVWDGAPILNVDEIKIMDGSDITPSIDRRVVLKKDISPVLSNQRISPYRLNSYDKLQIKLKLNIRGKPSHLKNVPVELYLNYTNEFVKYLDTVTDSNGIANITFPCYNISDNIEFCIGYVKTTVNNIVYQSNPVRLILY